MNSHKLYLLKKYSNTENIDDFPYKNLVLSESEIRQKFNKLENYRPTLEYREYKVYNITFLKRFLFKGQPTILVKYPSEYLDFNILSDYFQEFCRMKCQRYDTDISPYDYWVQNKDKVIEYSKQKYKSDDPHSLRETIYELTHECSAFRPSVMVSMIKIFKGKRVLDFSSGWGDRLLGALACDKIIDFYCGVDPNTCVHPNYQKMIKFFNKDPNKFYMINKPFQDAVLPNKTFNLVMTSPPYFILEKYSDEKTQSINTFESLNDWLTNFLFYSLKKCWNVLESGGHMVISINDMRDQFKFVEKMIKYINNKLEKSEYLGVISYAEKKGNRYKSPQPLWIWKKQS